MKLFKLFTQHPNSVGENYSSHFIEAAYCGIMMIYSGILCITHGVLPFLFTKTASKKLACVLARFKKRSSDDWFCI